MVMSSFGPGSMSGLSSECAPRATSADHSGSMRSHPDAVSMPGRAFGVSRIVENDQRIDGDAGPGIDQKRIDVDRGDAAAGVRHQVAQLLNSKIGAVPPGDPGDVLPGESDRNQEPFPSPVRRTFSRQVASTSHKEPTVFFAPQRT